MYAEELKKTFLGEFLGRMVQFNIIKFPFDQFVFGGKKTHFYSRVSLHEKNFTKNIETALSK